MPNEIKHYGTPRHSGRYPWGSGNDAYQRNASFLGTVKKLEDQGLSEVEIARGLNMKVSELREKKSIARTEKRAADAAEAQRLKDKGMSNVAIGERMHLNESSVRSLLDPTLRERSRKTEIIAGILRDNVDKKKFVDIGLGTEVHLGVSRTKLLTAVAVLEGEGYVVHNKVPVRQLGTGKTTYLMALAVPGTTWGDAVRAAHRDEIRFITDYSEDGGRSFLGLETPSVVKRDRVLVRYKEDGGINKDGVIELRRGVDDISLGNKKYMQVRIAVNGGLYMKGMAMYGDKMPEGYDIVYNTNKNRGTPDNEVFKKMKNDPDNPFGSTVRQKHFTGEDGQQHLSALNIVNEEGDWGEWSRSISSQVLSKQTPALAKKQLGIAHDMKQEEYDEIMSLTNPAVKKRLLTTFADEADAAAVHLKAAALPRQSSHVILPITSMKENEIYAPNFLPGETVVLIRHPHGGIFEIPELVVNNNNPEAKRVMKDAKDGVGINPKVAQRLSGADFDGDSVLVIPNRSGEIKTASPLKGLKDFDPSEKYSKYDGMQVMDDRTKQHKMGEVSNLITDMTIKGATDDEIARAVRHSMVVIDAVKHEYNWKQSYIDENIADLKRKYQGSEKGGAATIISRAKSPRHVDQRKEGVLIPDPNRPGKMKRLFIDPETGKKLYEETGKTDTYKIVKDPVTGKKVRDYTQGTPHLRTQKSTKMAEEADAFNLSSGTPIETVYAKHANAMKALANQARKASVEIEDTPYSPSARTAYAKEAASLKAKLDLALMNKPLERQAQLIANKVISTKIKDNPDLEEDDLKKKKGQALTEARLRVGAHKSSVEITDREWEAIQAGALSTHALSQILLNTDLKKLKQRAMPRPSMVMSPARVARARAMRENGSPASEIAQALGVSVDTINTVLD